MDRLEARCAMRRAAGFFLLSVLATWALGACGLGNLTGGHHVDVNLDEYHVNLASGTAPAGQVTFDVHNRGRDKHEFVVLKSDLSVGSLPDASGEDAGKVQEEAPGIVHVDEIGGLGPGEDRSLTVDLKSGTYLLICNFPGHVHSGMAARLVVG
jgi:sulfocyanin SoxE-like protein